MRPTTSTMLQQNNNNNYPCLGVPGSTQELLHKCSRAALPLPSRLELGDLPLIRGLRAWALCSRNRRKPGGLLGGRQAPAAPHAGRGSSTSCSQPPGVRPSGEWGRTRYGLPLGLDARQAEVGALVTVATLKTSEGSGKTQTQCLFLQTEKGSCLYSTAKPGSGGTASAGNSVVGGWLRGKTGAGSTHASAGRRDIGPNPPAHTGANRVRAGSGRRWRKSGNAAGCEKAGVSRERHQRSREDPGEITAEERKEVQDKGAPDDKQPPSPQQHKNEGVCRPPRCCHNAPPQSPAQCQEEQGGESPSAGKKGAQERQQNEEEGGVCELGPSGFASVPNSDPESDPEVPGGCGAEESREELKGRNTGSEDEQDTESGPSETLPDAFKLKQDGASSDGNPAEKPRVGAVDGFSEDLEASGGFEIAMQSTEEEGEQSVAQTLPVAGVCDSIHPDLGSASFPESSAPLEGGVGTAEQGREREEGQQAAEEDHAVFLISVSHETNIVKTRGNSKTSAPLRTKCPSNRRSDGPTAEAEPGDELVSDADEARTEAGGSDRERSISARQEDDSAAKTNCAAAESADGCRAETEEDGASHTSVSRVEAAARSSTNVTNAACADPFTSPALSQANPALPLPPLASMATSLPCAATKEEVWEDGVTARDGEGGQEGARRHRRELEGETGSTVASEGGRREEEEQEEEQEQQEEEEEQEQQEEEEQQEQQEQEFGLFVQAEGEPAWSEDFASASVPCGSGASAVQTAPGSGSISEDWTRWTPGGTGPTCPRSDDTWTAFPLEPPQGPDGVGQWWPSGAADEGRDGLSAGPNALRVFAEAFPSEPGSSCEPASVPTLTQLLRGRASRDQGLLDSFLDLNKVMGWRSRPTGSASRDLLLRTLHLEQPLTETRAAPWTANRRLSPGLPSANHNALSAAAKRRLSCDYNRNLME